MIDYFVLTQVIIDDIYIGGELKQKNVLGGGAYTAAGMRIWSRRVGMCSGAGEDWEELIAPWFRRNGIDLKVTVKHKRSARQYTRYFPDGEREEILVEGTGSLPLMQPQVSEIPPEYRHAKGIYIYKDCDRDFWKSIEGFLKDNPMSSVWELSGYAAFRENESRIAELLPLTDIVSLNRTEGRGITGLEDPVEIVKRLLDRGASVVLLRMGKDGSLAADRQEIWHIPAAVGGPVLDVTGGGNASTGGFLAGWGASGGSLVHAGLCASVSASFIIEQYGLPGKIDERMMNLAEKRLKTLKPDRLQGRKSCYL
jgi:sugar/nucleoside kinase (ribokinase family)